MDRWPLDVTALGPAACGVRLWKGPGTRHLTVLVKANLELVHDGPAKLISGAEIVVKDRHYLDSPGRSLGEATELSPYLARCDVTLFGHAHAPPGQPQSATTVRLALFRGSTPLLDKKLFVFGDTDPAVPGQRTAFQTMPLDYEHALGGKSNPNNPVGRGAEKKGPNVVDPVDAARSAGFAPLSRFWGQRARLLGRASRALVDAPEAEIPDGFDFRYFQAAPEDQQIPYLTGDEWIVLDGMHPVLPRFSTQLPGVRGAALVFAFSEGGYGPAQPIKLEADTLTLDADGLTASIVWRGSMLIDSVSPEALKVFGGVQLAGAPIPWPNPRSLESPKLSRLPEVPSEALDPSGTHVLTAHEAERAARSRSSPFAPAGSVPVALPVEPSAPRDASESFGETAALPPQEIDGGKRRALPFPSAVPVIHEAPPPSQSVAPIAPVAAPSPPAAPPTKDFAETVTHVLSPRQAEQAAKSTVHPFAPPAPGSKPFSTRAQPPPPREESTDFGSTLPLSKRAQKSAREAAPLPFESARHGIATSIPRRESPQVPIVNPTNLTVTTTSWQLTPSKDSLTIIVKGTFDLVHDGAATIREEADPLTGDVYADDDLQKSLLVASDFAVTKPRADVVLTGCAHARRGAAHARVSFRFGAPGPRGFDRAINVLGNRTWQSAIALSPSDPAPFEKMSLVYDRAFGGPSFADNPLGTDLPNLEDPDRPITAPGDVRKPACFAPIPPLWKERASKSGTYGADWLATRWPYFPADFDSSHFQFAPASQQLPHLTGDESYEIVGMHSEHPIFHGTLPGLRVRVFACEKDVLSEIPLALDTAAFDVEESKLNLVWRGVAEVSDDEATEIETLFLHTEPLASEPLSLDAVMRVLLEALPPNEPLEEPDPPEVPVVVEGRAAALRELALARIGAGLSLDGLDLAGADLTSLDFAGRSLVSANLKEAKLGGSSLARADLSQAVLSEADLRDCDLTSAVLAGADLASALLERAVLDDVDLSGADLSHVHADGASFRGARGEGVQFAGGTFIGAHFEKAELAGADFGEAVLDGAVFDDAVLTEVRLYYARGDTARFARARLDGARGDDCRLVRTSFAGAHAPGSIWEKATLTESSFLAADLAGASFARASCEDASFGAADAKEARFVRAKLARAKFVKTNLYEANFERADLTSADLTGANLHGAETWKAKLAGARLDLAIVTRSKLAGRA